MNMIKNNKGVTIMMLVVTIIVLIIVTSFAIFYSNNIAPEAKLATAYTSLSQIKKACMEAQASIALKPDEYDEYYFFGKNLSQDGSNKSDIAARCGLLDVSELGERSYKITPENDDEVKRRIKRLEISTVNDGFIVDLDNGKYYILGGVKRKTQDVVYEYREIEKLYEMLTTSGN